MPAYFDYAATAPLTTDAKIAMIEAMDRLGNPGSTHAHGQRARRALEDARDTIAAAIGAEPIETILTSGGTESDNLAIKGLYWARNHEARTAGGPSRPRILSTKTEHHAILDTIEWLVEHEGAEAVWIPVDAAGRLDLDALEAELDDRAALVAILAANNEIGTVQPVRGVVERAHAVGVPVHIDAVAAFGSIPVSLAEWGADTLAVAAHKIGGPVGIGALAVRRGLKLEALVHGGGQQLGMRSGTQNVVSAVGFAAAAAPIAARAADERALAPLDIHPEVRATRQSVIDAVLAADPDAVLRGAPVDEVLDDEGTLVPGRLPGNAHFTFPGLQADSLTFGLDMAGVSASSGSACQAGIAEPSHVLAAAGVSAYDAAGALRLTVSASTTEEEVAQLAKALPGAIESARKAGFLMGGTPA